MTTMHIQGLSMDAMAAIVECGENIAAVTMETERDDTGIDYAVVITDRRLDCYERGDNQRGVWSARVNFGQTDATVAGGSAFVCTAREQQRIADAVWALVHRP